MSSRPVAVLDACVLINLLATGRAEDIMSESGYQFGICSVVKNESIYLRATDLNAPPEEVKLDAALLRDGDLLLHVRWIFDDARGEEE